MHRLPSLLALVASVHAHYHLANIGIGVDPQFQTVRTPLSYGDGLSFGNLGMDLRDSQYSEFTCNTMAKAPKVFTVAAGSVIPVYFSEGPWHPGPYQVYMAKTPANATAADWTPSGEVWFKVFSGGADFSRPGQPGTFPAAWPNPMNIPLPRSIPSGDYIVRAEQIGLHLPGSPQFWLGCGQVTVTGGGDGKPGPLVAFPGAYKQDDPSLLVNIRLANFTSYTPPGPVVWTG